jgi:hypothetical protein
MNVVRIVGTGAQFLLMQGWMGYDVMSALMIEWQYRSVARL